MLDAVNQAILKMIGEGLSIEEMIDANIGLKSTSSVHMRIRQLEELGLVDPPPKRKMSRSRFLTELGIRYLVAAGYWKERKAGIYRDYLDAFYPARNQ